VAGAAGIEGAGWAVMEFPRPLGEPPVRHRCAGPGVTSVERLRSSPYKPGVRSRIQP
jgi:hypothetical protein